MTKFKTESISAIENGTVIDHIESGIGVKMIRLLELVNHKKRISLALNLPSKTRGIKDLIKLEDRILSDRELDVVAILSPKATINLIRDYEVLKKFQVKTPEEIIGHFLCPNKRCISCQSETATRFNIIKAVKAISLKCHYCERESSLKEIVEIY